MSFINIFKNLSLLEKLEKIQEDLEDDIVLLPLATKRCVREHLKSYKNLIDVVIDEVKNKDTLVTDTIFIKNKDTTNIIIEGGK